MKKKVGPLPLWAWIVVIGGAIGAYLLYKNNSSSSSSTSGNTVDPNNPLGLTYAQEQQDIAQGIDPNTGQSYASEQAAADQAYNASGGGSGGDTGTTSGTGTTGDPTADAELAQIDSDIQGLNANITGGGLTDTQTPAQTFGGEIADVVGGIQALQAAGLLGTAAPATATKKQQPALTAKGAQRAPSGPTKPTAPKGFKAVGLGSGNWEFVPIVASHVNTQTKPSTTHHTTPARSTHVSGGKKKK